ncbi:MAG: nitrilase-related carbon-nitrogen hydrolase, partial [Flavobacteriaceae bacterium]|nr:nitrilase-related carbon-nitrogen hydrolase [Flavobacteriaceae bacterium]
LIVHFKGWRICPLICYDLRFPVWSRNTNNYDLLLFMANWPVARIDAWDTLLKARAIENMSYCIGINRIGEDANGYQYNGHTTAYDFLGKEIARTKEGKEDLLQCLISKTLQEETRKKLSFLNDKDSFKIQ